jgi:hypothetical protein
VHSPLLHVGAALHARSPEVIERFLFRQEDLFCPRAVADVSLHYSSRSMKRSTHAFVSLRREENESGILEYFMSAPTAALLR